MTNKNKIKIGISIGDFNGIGIEVLLKICKRKKFLEYFTFIIFCSKQVIEFYLKKLKIHINFNYIYNIKDIVLDKHNVLNVWHNKLNIIPGKSTYESSKYALISLFIAVKNLSNKFIDTLIVLPIDSSSMYKYGFKYFRYKNYLDDIFNVDSMMVLMDNNLNISLLTDCVYLNHINYYIIDKFLIYKFYLLQQILIKDFNYSHPKIAVLGLNNYCECPFLMSKQDKIIKKVISFLFDKGILLYGLFSSKSFFCHNYNNFDITVSVYFDQIFTTFKLLSLYGGVIYFAGLPYVIMHLNQDVSYDISGLGIADESYLKEAILYSIDIYNNKNIMYIK